MTSMKTFTAQKEMNRYKKLKIKCRLIKADLKFLNRCKKLKVIPKFVQGVFKTRGINKKAANLIKEAQVKFLHMEIKRHHWRTEKITREMYQLQLYLMNVFPGMMWTEIDNQVEKVTRIKYGKKIKVQEKKLRVLVRERSVHENIDVQQDVVVNKSSMEIRPDQHSLLNKGLKYCPQPLVLPTDDLVVSLESTIKNMNWERKAAIREDTRKVLEGIVKTSSSNVRDERATIKQLNQAGCVFLPPDKGKGVVVMDKTHYHQAATEHLDSGPYEKVRTRKEFPVDLLQQKVRDGLRDMRSEGLLSIGELKSLVCSNPVIPSFSCLPKTHKRGNKVRPVVSNVNSPTSKICGWLVKRFRSFTRPFSFSVKNSIDLAEKLHGMSVERDEIMVSLDVEALYPSVPVEEAYSLYQEWIESQEISDIEAQKCIRLMRIVLDQRWFTYNGAIYQQNEGLFIGNGLSPILAEIFMGQLEKKVSGRAQFPRVWCRYVDDIISVVKRGEQETVLEMLNLQHTAINFTIEEERDNEIPFLDLKVIRSKGRIELDIYRKPTDAPLCIPADSYHPWSHKHAAFESAISRMWKLPLTVARREKELRYIKNMACLNGYKDDLVDSINTKHKMRSQRTQFTKLRPMSSSDRKPGGGSEDQPRMLVLPYIKYTSEKLERVLRKRGLHVVYRRGSSLKQLIGSTKPPTPEMEKSGIYEIDCLDCDMTYIGQTKRRIETRNKEHGWACKNKEVERSSVAEHCVTENHRKGGCKLLQGVGDQFLLDGYESLHIARGDRLMNAGEPPIKSVLFNKKSKI